MPKYPGAIWRPVERYKSGNRLAVPMTRYDAVVGHTAVSNATPSMHEYFNVAGRATPHVYFGQHGECEQYIDTDFRSSAVLNGNHRCITWESWDGWPNWPNGVCPPWTDEQIEAMIDFVKWCHEVHKIPVAQMPDSKSTSRGIGWHRLGIDGNFPTGLLRGRVPEGEVWSYSSGKTCPTDLRIKQIVEEIIPRANGVSMAEWSDKLDKWVPGDPNTTDVMSAGKQLTQARGFSAASYHLLLKLADVDAFATAVASKLDSASFTSEQLKQAVKDALKEGVV